MNFEDLAKAWQCQKPGVKVTINDSDALLRDIRLTQRLSKIVNFWGDMFIVGVEAFLIVYFLRAGMRLHDWAGYLMASACFFIGVFILVDRWRQRRRRPITNESLVSCIKSSLVQVKHEIWRSKNIFWWYVLPLEIGFAGTIASGIWRARNRGVRHFLEEVLEVAVFALICGLIGWVTYWLSKFSLRKSLEPRRKELEELLASLNEDVSEASQPLSAKKSANRKILFLIVALLVAIPVVVGIVMHRAAPASSEVGHDLEAIRKKHNLPALALVVTKDGQICERDVAGVRKWGETALVTTNDLFHIGGCTESMTATLTAMLIEEGKLRWDTTIQEVFPELKGKMDRQYEAVTVEQLLRHHGGVPTEPPHAAWKRAWKEKGTPMEQRREFITSVLIDPPAAAPGTKSIYSSQDYAVIGAMLEKITVTPYEKLISEKLFQPLHMGTAGFGSPGALGGLDQPWGHVREMFLTVPDQGDNPPAVAPAGRVHCSLDDLARFAMFHLQGATNGLLKAETMKRLHTPSPGNKTADEADNSGCGWMLLKRGWADGNALWHNGSNTRWHIVMWLAPNRDFSVIAVTNIAGPDAEQGCDEAATMMIKKWLVQ
jgi:CubicO group peptidase (beta-lactamase class C family)